MSFRAEQVIGLVSHLWILSRMAVAYPTGKLFEYLKSTFKAIGFRFLLNLLSNKHIKVSISR